MATFFDANIETKFYELMKKVGEMADAAAADLKNTEGKIEKFGNRVEEAFNAKNKIASDIEAAAVQLQDAFKAEDEVNREIFRKFSKYEKVAVKLQRADLEDVSRLVNPDLRVRLAVYVYATMFEGLELNEYSSALAACEDKVYKQWWSVGVKSVIDALTLRKIRNFSIERLRGQQASAKVMITKGRSLYPFLVREVHEELQKLMLQVPVKSNSSVVKNDLVVGMKNDTAVNSLVALVNQDDDFDMDVKHKGRWVKGEWVPFHRLPHEIQHEIQQDIAVHQNSSNRKAISSRGSSRNSNRIMFLTEPKKVESSSAEAEEPPVVEVGYGMNSKKRKAKTRLSVVVDENLLKLDDQIQENDSILEVTDCYHFVSVMLSFLRAVVRFSLDGVQLSECKQITAKRSMELEDLKLKHKYAVTHHHTEIAIREGLEKDLITFKRRVRSLDKRVRVFREKVRVARLLNRVSVNGHTPISWAASLGAYEVVEEMLSRGSTVGFTPELLNWTATYLQMSYRICITSRKIKPQRVLDPKTAKYVMAKPQAQNTQEVIVELTKMKDTRMKLLRRILFQRARMRFPVPEAIYTAKWEIIKRIHERKLLHANFVSSWIFPSPPPPYRRNFDHQYEHTKIGPFELLAYGMSNLAAGIYVDSIGWVPPNDPREPYGETQKELEDIVLDLKERRAKYERERVRVRLLAQEKRNQQLGELEMAVAIRNKNFEQCIHLAENRGITIDLETEEGFTALTSAAEENVEAVNHSYMHNTDGTPCLQVVFLLDRFYYRPAVNLETKTGYTALIKAAALSRAHVLEALLDRGAEINYKNRLGKTALHYTVMNGNIQCTRILVERLADLTVTDNDGLTPYQIADREGFADVMLILSQFTTGFLGTLQVSRGRVNNVVTCPLGCGKRMTAKETAEHCKVCDLREVSCVNNCGETKLMLKDMDSHLQFDCFRRPITCKDCADPKVVFEEMEMHLADLCTFRFVQCPLGCGKEKRFFDLERHQRVCTWRIVECPLKCGIPQRMVECDIHVKNDCINRRVSCPLKCRGLVVFKHLQQHLQDVCNCRPAECKFCKKVFVKKQLETHHQECESRLQPCKNKCGANVPLDQMEVHMRETCVHRVVPCPLLCGLQVREINLGFHQQSECVNRQRPCEYGCVESEAVPELERVVTKVPSKLMSLHLKYDCPERPVRCSLCLQDVKAKLTTVHDMQECGKRPVSCRVEGCLRTLPFAEREDHERFHCRFRLISCAQGCGERISFIHSGKHMNKQCPMRMLECPLGCGVRLRQRDVEVHTSDECIRRFSATNSSSLSSGLLSRTLSKLSLSQPSTPAASRPTTGKSPKY